MKASGASENRSHLDRTISFGVLLTVVFTGLAFGAVEPWAVFVFEAIIIGLVFLWGVKVVRDGRLRLTLPAAALPFVALILFGLIQSLALTGADGRWMSLSMNVGHTRSTVVLLSFMFIALILAANFFASRERLAGLGHVLVFYGLGVSLFALVQYFTWSGRFYWVRPTMATSAFGPFANHNHFAGYMELLIPLPVALVITRAVSKEVRVLYGFAAVVMGLAAVASLSRGGMISLAAMFVFMGIVGMRLPSVRRSLVAGKSARGAKASQDTNAGIRAISSRVVVIAALVAFIGAGVLWIGADPIIQRVAPSQAIEGQPSETFAASRGWIWRDAATMIRANPLLGVGLGAFGTAFNIYTQGDGSVRVPQAHNDYLQIVADCGIVGGLIALWFVIVVFRTAAQGLKARDPLLSGLALGSASGIFGILVHSLFDFNLQIPSNALLFLVLVAVGSSVAAIVRASEKSATLSRASSGEIGKARIPAAVLIGGA